mmetsp:Transcript_51844/g.155588  ORF Transcript_51844/g.155588 Transcript_51844/m.155588 type:complete len:1193 (-) Transcript_51844:49-3627(-)
MSRPPPGPGGGSGRNPMGFSLAPGNLPPSDISNLADEASNGVGGPESIMESGGGVIGEEYDDFDQQQQMMIMGGAAPEMEDDGIDPALRAANIPEEYLYDPFNAEPVLESLRSLDAEKATLSELLEAADGDVLLHSARIRAVLLNDASVVETYRPETDEMYRDRMSRRAARDREKDALNESAREIMAALDAGQSKDHMTQSEVLAERLERWQRALELYVHAPEGGGEEEAKVRGTMPKVDLLGLLEKLCEGCSEEEELLEALSQASQMCTALVEHTSLAVRDATEDAAEAEDAYHIRLEAHSVLARRATEEAEAIEERFKTNGRAALRIGQSLELAETKRRQCDSASTLIRRWWMMENLAEQEEASGEEIRVKEEVRGIIPSSSCRMDPLFTRPENSLEAARALKSLRTVVKSRGNSAAVSGSAAPLDPKSAQRFELTGLLIQRTSAALEQRLLNSVSEIYSRGGTYDFSSVESAGRAGRLDWVALRELAEALTYFDQGRTLHRRYVQLVVTTRFPEFSRKKKKTQSRGEEGGYSDEESEEEEEFDMDATRSELSNLFHRVSEVCTAEFQLVAHVFAASSAANAPGGGGGWDIPSLHSEPVQLQVARALLQRVISDPKNGLQARINDLLASIDRRGDFDAGAKKLDTFVVIHEKAAGLFALLKDAAEQMFSKKGGGGAAAQGGADGGTASASGEGAAAAAANARAVASLVQFLTSQEMNLASGHRRGYLNLELRLLHHECCAGLDRIGVRLMRPLPNLSFGILGGGSEGGLAEYSAPVMPVDKEHVKQSGYAEILNGALKQSVLRQPLIHATDSLARARLMFGGGLDGRGGDAEATARVISAIFSQMCSFYGQAYLFPIMEGLGEMLPSNPPSNPPNLPFDERRTPHDLGVDGSFWVGIERIHSAAKGFDRELWAEQRTGSARVWEILSGTRSHSSLSAAREKRLRFFNELERRGETSVLKALDTLSTHIQWILVTGGEGMLATGGTRLLHTLTGQGGGPYAVPAGSALDATNSPSVKSLTYCLRAQFVHIQAALTPQSLSSFWTALSMRLYDILCARLLQHYYVSTVGAVILSRDVEALRSVAMLAGTQHNHWDMLRELLTLYMTPPDALKTMLVGPDGDVNSGKGLFARTGRDQALVFMSRRVDYRIKTNQGMKKCQWAVDLIDDLGVQDPTDGPINLALYAAETMADKS